MPTPKRIKIEPAKAYSDEAAYGRDKYNAQNVLYIQVNFPAHVYEGDDLASVWSDRVYAEWQAARKIVPPGALQNMDDASFLKFVAALVGRPIDGARAVRYSDAGGYEVFRIDTWKRGPASPGTATYSGMAGPNVIRPKRERFVRPDGRYWPGDVEFYGGNDE